MPYLVGYITPQDYNSAAGDGVTDVTTAIQSAINAAAAGVGGQTLFFPGGTYIISSALVLSSLVTYLGSEDDASIIKLANASNVTAMAATTGWLANTSTSSANPLQMRHLIWDGNKANQTSGAGHGVVLQSFYTNIEYCTFRNTRGDGLRWDAVTSNGATTISNTCVENRVQRCQMRNCAGDGFHVNDPTNNKVTDGWFIDNIVDTPGGNAVNIQAGAGWIVQGTHSYNVGFSAIRVDRMFQTRIVNNYMESCGASTTAGTYALIDGLNGQINDGGQGSSIYGNVGFFQGPPGNAGSTIVGIGVQAATAATATVSIVANQLFQTGTTGLSAIQIQNQAATSTINARVAGNTTIGWTTPLNQIINGGSITLNGDFGQYASTPATAANIALYTNVLGTDAFDRFRLLADGTHLWGSGTAARDVQIARSAAGTLAVTSPTSSVASETITGANAAGQVLKVTNTTSAPTADNVLLTSNAAADSTVGIQVAGDTKDRWTIDSNGKQQWGPGGGTAVDTDLFRSGVAALQTDGFFAMGSGQSGGSFTAFSGAAKALIAGSAGGGLAVKEGTNARMGTAALTAGAVTVANTSVTATSRIFLTSQVDGGTPGFLRVSTRTAGTSFTITSSSGTDTSTVAYLIVEPA